MVISNIKDKETDMGNGMLNENTKPKLRYGKCAVPLAVFTVLYGIFSLKFYYLKFTLLFLPELGLLWLGFFITLPLCRFGRYRLALVFAVLRYAASVVYLIFMMFTPFFPLYIFELLLGSIFTIILLPFIILPLFTVIVFGGFLIGGLLYETAYLVNARNTILKSEGIKPSPGFRY